MENTVVIICYTNYKGITKEYHIIPKKITFDANNWYKTKQWLLTAEDVERKVDRTFAMKNIAEWKVA